MGEIQSEVKPAANKKQNKLFHWISAHPFGVCVAFVASLCSIAGVPLAIYLYYAVPKRELSYCINPVRTPIAQTAKPSDVTIAYKGKPVGGNVTAVQVAIWNAGRESIKVDNVLRPVIIDLGTNRILETTLLRTNREVSEFQLDINHLEDFRTGVRWHILEKNDGAVIQIVYVGTVEAPVTISGVIEGQGSIVKLRSTKTLHDYFQVAGMLFCVLGALVYKAAQGSYRQRKGHESMTLAYIAVVAFVLFIALTMYGIWSPPPKLSPFGF